ncbi:MAG: hypothetical protein ACR2RF_03775 [Geminicoccaceae bacterium]
MSVKRNTRTNVSDWWLVYERCGPAIDAAGNRCVAPRLSTIEAKGWQTLFAAFVLFAMLLLLMLSVMLGILSLSNPFKSWFDIFAFLYFMAMLGASCVLLRHAMHWDALADTFRRPDVAGYYDDDGEEVEESAPPAQTIGTNAPPDYEAHVVDAAGNPV